MRGYIRNRFLCVLTVIVLLVSCSSRVLLETVYATDTDEQIVQSDLSALTFDVLCDQNKWEVTENISLPTIGEGGAAITWTSDNPDAITISGNEAVVTRPTDKNATVVLTAHLSKGEAESKKEFAIGVPKQIQYIVDEDFESYSVGGIPQDVEGLYSWNLGSATVQSDGSKYLSYASGVGQTIQLSTPVEEMLVVEAKLKRVGSSTYLRAPVVYSNTNEEGPYVFVHPADIRAYNGNTAVKLQDLTQNQWYIVKLVADIGTDTYDVYIDGEIAADDYGFRVQTNNLSKIEYRVPIDDLKVYLTETMKPVARKVSVSGDMTVGEQIVGNYAYYHSKDLAEGDSIYRWLADEEIDGTYDEVLDEGTISAGNDISFTIPAEALNKYLRLEITPVSENDEKGEATLSEPFGTVSGGILPTAPEAKTVTISGEACQGKTLTGSYEYHDANGDAEYESIHRWLSFEEIDGAYTVVSESRGTASSEITYIVQESDVNRYIVLEIIPKATESPQTDSYFRSTPTAKVLSLAERDEQIVYSDITALTFDSFCNQKKWEVTENISLPTTGEGGAAITWTSDNPDVITISGNEAVVIRPAEKNATVVLTAHLSKGEAENEKEFAIGVPKQIQYIVNENFESYSIGGTPQDIEGLYSWNLGSATVQSDDSKYLAYSSGVGQTIQLSTPVEEKLVVEAKLKRIGSLSYLRAPVIYSNIDSEGPYVFVHTADIRAYNEETTVKLQDLTENQWYTVKIVADAKTDTYDVYIDGGLVADDYGFRTEIDNLTKIEYRVPIDDLKIYSTEAMKPIVRKLSVSGDACVGEQLIGNYAYYHSMDVAEGNSIYRWLAAEEIDGTYDEVLGEGTVGAGNVINFTVPSEARSKYLRLEITPVSEDGEKGEASLSTPFGIVYGPPEAKNVSISGFAGIGNILEGCYDFYDDEGEREGVSLYRWLRGTNETGEFEPIPYATGKTYTLTSADNGCYVRFEVTPVGLVAPIMGTPVQSESIGLIPTAPMAKNVTITGDACKGKTLVGSYEYHDANGDAEFETVHRWLSATEVDGEYTIIKESVGTALDEITYTIQESDVNRYIVLEIVPKTAISPQTGSSVRSVPTAKIVSAPEASGVVIKGNASVGQRLMGEYVFRDVNGDTETNSVYQWYRSTNSTSGFEKIVGANAISYDVTGRDENCYLKFAVTPRAEKEPYFGEEKFSNAVYIKSRATGGGGSSGGGSGRYTKINDAAPSTELNSNDNVQNVVFTDVENHWAKLEILFMGQNKFVNGFSDKRFMPDDAITRAEFITIVIRVLKQSETDYQNDFSDVKANDWYAGIIQKAFELGIVSGNNGVFRPNDKITREEASKILLSAYEIKTNKDITLGNEETGFADSNDISEWAKPYVSKAVSLGLIKGDENKHFSPLKNATRAEAAVMMKRFLDL